MTTITAFIRRRPVLTFYILAFTISWGGILLVIGGHGGLPRTQDEFTTQVVFAIPAMLGGPSVAGILMTGLVAGRAGLRELRSRLLRWRVGARWYAIALLTAPLVFAAVHAALSLVSPVYRSGVITTADTTGFLLAGIVSALMVGFFEELGWTGFAIPRLRLRYGVLATGLVVGVLWGAWHILAISVWPSVALAGELSLPLFIAVNVVTLVVGQLAAYRVLMVWVYDRTGSLLVAMLMHASLTASTFILGPSVISGSANVTYGFALGAVWWVVVAAVAAANGGQLARQPLRRQVA